MDDSVKGVVQFCDNGEWKTLCAGNNWLTAFSSIAVPHVICRQLGYSKRGISYLLSMSHTFDVCMYTGATRGSVCSSSPTPPHFSHPVCNGVERSLLECRRTSRDSCLRLSCTGNDKTYGAVTCIKGEFIAKLN